MPKTWHRLFRIIKKMNVKGTIPVIVTYLMQQEKKLKNKKQVFYCQIKKNDNFKKRTIDQNSYYWHLVGEYCKATGESQVKVHNELLIHYGQLDIVDGLTRVLVDKDSNWYLYTVNEHYKPSSKTIKSKKGTTLRYFYKLRGSRTYNKKEMMILIKGLINEIIGSELNIDYLSDEEIMKMKNPNETDKKNKTASNEK